MTIKRNGDRVILKDGKVSCSCCEAGECCMYPAATLVAGIYGYQDLPDAIDVGGIEYTKLDPPQSVSGFTRYYINENEEYLGILEGEGEDSLWTYEGGGGPCLINGFNGEGGEREDQFADTYTASGVPAPGGGTESVSLSRISLCVWQGVDSCGGPVLLSYDGIAEGSGGPFGTYHWYITWVEYPFFNLFGCNSTPEGYGSEKTDPQSSPAGTYEGNATITVS